MPSTRSGKKERKPSVKDRIRAFFVKNVGIVVTRQEIQVAATDPETKRVPENWHQRLSELRVDEGYDILSNRDRDRLKPGQYLLETPTPTRIAKPRARLRKADLKALFERDSYTCQWPDCTLRKGQTDPVGGGRVVLTADHRSPHSLPNAKWTGTLEDWQTLCARHQQKKKNLIDDRTGRKNLRELVRNAKRTVKLQIFEDLTAYFGQD